MGINLLYDFLFLFSENFLTHICKTEPETRLNYDIGTKKVPLVPVMTSFYITQAGQRSFMLMMGQPVCSRSWM